jgi:hypothetical protein
MLVAKIGSLAVTLGIARPSQYASAPWPASREGRRQSTFSAPNVVMPMLGPTGTRLPTTSCRTDEMVTPVVTVPDGHGGKVNLMSASAGRRKVR